MVKRSTPSRVAKRKVVRTSTRRKLARTNRKSAKLVIGRKKFPVRVTCKGKVRFTRAGRRKYNAVKRSLKVKCRVGKRRRTLRSRTPQKATYNWL